MKYAYLILTLLFTFEVQAQVFHWPKPRILKVNGEIEVSKVMQYAFISSDYDEVNRMLKAGFSCQRKSEFEFKCLKDISGRQDLSDDLKLRIKDELRQYVDLGIVIRDYPANLRPTQPIDNEGRLFWEIPSGYIAVLLADGSLAESGARLWDDYYSEILFDLYLTQVPAKGFTDFLKIIVSEDNAVFVGLTLQSEEQQETGETIETVFYIKTAFEI